MKPNLRGPMEAHAYPLVSLRSGCFFPVGQSHTAAQHTDIAWTSLSQACSSHFGTDERLIRGPQRERCPSRCFTAAWALASAVIWTNVCRVRSVHEKKDIHVHYIHTHAHTHTQARFTFSLPLCEWGLYGCKLVGAIRVSHSVRQQL